MSNPLGFVSVTALEKLSKHRCQKCKEFPSKAIYQRLYMCKGCLEIAKKRCSK